MPFVLMCFVTLAYAYVASCFAAAGNWPWALVYGGYALANVGLIVAMGGS